MLKLGVNIDHIATLREARYAGRDRGEPDPIEAALICEAAGAHGITAHLREDRRHIQDRDIWKLRESIKTRLNLEMANTPEMADIATRVRPDIVCIVPDPRKVDASVTIGAKIIELYTGYFAEHFNRKKERAEDLYRLVEDAKLAHTHRIRVNAGHACNTQYAPILCDTPHLV